MNRKKTILAVGLLGVMAVMWVRVLLNKQPGAAVATTPAQQAADATSERSTGVTFVELPVVAGRHDSISRDFFDAGRWRNFTRQDRPNGSSASHTGDPDERLADLATRAAKMLTLEAIVHEDTWQARINDRVVRLGETLQVKEGDARIEFEVVHIYRNAVDIRSGSTQVTLRLTEEHK